MTPQPTALYNLIFLPEVQPGRQPEEVADALARTFGQPREKYLEIFKRAPIVIRRDMDQAAAEEFQAKIEKAGAQTRIEPTVAEDPVRDRQPQPTQMAPDGIPAPPPARDLEPDPPFFFFVPRAQIVFPPRCVCCFREAPNAVLPISSLGTTPDTTGNIGAGAGWVMGGLAGALIGKVVEESVREASASARRALDGIVKEYDVPICSKCAGTMKREGDAELWEERARRHGGRCRCLVVDPAEGYLAVKFEQPEFSKAFAEVNSGLVSTELATFEREVLHRRPDPGRGAHCVTLLARYMRMSGEDQAIEERVPRHLRKWFGSSGYFTAPEIPPHILDTARRSCGIEPDDTVLGLICEVDGSINQCIAITARGVSFSNGANGNPPRGGRAWGELDAPGTLPTPIQLELWAGEVVDGARIGVSPSQVLLVIESIRLSLQEPPIEIPSGPIPLPGASLPSEAPPRSEAVDTPRVWVPTSSAVGPADASEGEIPTECISLDTESLQELRARLERRSKFQKCWIGDEIPPKKLANASKMCGVPPESVLCLVDCTIFGTAKNCLLVTEKGIHYHNDFKGGTPVGNFSGHLSFDELERRQFRFEDPYCIYMGETDVLEISSVITFQDDILGLLNDLRRFAVDRPE